MNVNRYAYAVSSALHGVGNILYKDFMIQVWWLAFIFLFYNREYFQNLMNYLLDFSPL